jgi:hypothetical protein
LRIFIILLAFILVAGSSLGQNTTNQAGQNNSTDSKNPALMGSATLVSVLSSPASEEKTAEIHGIWSFNLKGSEHVTVALHQNGKELFGSGKSDPSGWNAAVLGSISGTQIALVMTALTNNSLNSIGLTGTFQNGTISGTFVQSDDLGNTATGLFEAVLVNKDLSGYSPSKLVKPATQTANSPSSSSISAPASAPTPATAGRTQPKQLGDPKYVDVHSMSGYVPESLGVGFVGDGTMGAGGSSMG